MPYIDAVRQDEVKMGDLPGTPGELTYLLYYTALVYLHCKPEIRYSDLNEVRGALIGAWQEFEQQIVRPYEDRKKQANPVVEAESLVRRIIPCD